MSDISVFDVSPELFNLPLRGPHPENIVQCRRIPYPDWFFNTYTDDQIKGLQKKSKQFPDFEDGYSYDLFAGVNDAIALYQESSIIRKMELSRSCTL